MADSIMKKYLDLEGLKAYDGKIKGVISTAETSAKAYTDEKIGSLDTGVATVAAAILKEKQARELADTGLQNQIGVASKAQVGEVGQEGYEAAVEATGLNKRIESLEKLVGAGNKSVAEQIEEVTGKLDELDTDNKDNLVDAINEVDSNVDDLAELVGELPNGATADTVVGYVDEAIENAIDGLDAEDNKSDTVAGITIEVSEADGVVSKPVVTVADNAVTYTASADAIEADPEHNVEAKDAVVANLAVADANAVLKGDAIAAIKSYVDDKTSGVSDDTDEKIEALQALHAKDAESGEYLTVAQEVAKVVDGAPEALDTLKEIADWIANTDENNAVTSSKLITTVDKLDGADTVEGSVKNQIKTAIEDLDATVTNGTGKAAVGTEGEADYVPAVAETQDVVISITEEDGKITGVTVDASVLKNAIAGDIEDLDAEIENEAATGDITIKAAQAAQGTAGEEGYVPAKDAVVVSGTNLSADGVHSKIVEEDGVITDFVVEINTITTVDIDKLFD